ncbi:hypothetical protein Poli38472_005273 [Pythium oligandrum]|uniref:Uncharacterized protein n=1 Tax=Pythium oligandrum TaxID=41045 RepID=A0A8K1FGD9_PYTOL|nr:hypothetical protein Poli38472_005273 [Pythium oligandrum]|eukprot:TMW62655.1 hypothetical protein Poli38472_005273 [Pythium oligandrum]
MTESYPASAPGSAAMDTDSDGYSEKLRLKIQPHPPKFPFRDHPFEITVYLVDPSDHLKAGINLPLNVELYAAEKMVPVEKQIMHIDSSTKPVMNGDGICKLRVRISECSMALGNRKFVIHISAGKQAATDYTVIPAVTSEMTVIQHRLVIQENLPDLWYKDEGGRDKCMLLPIHLVNEKNERVQGRQVPLRVTLLYENEHPVLKQDILKMSPDCQRMIDTTGKSLLKLRIEDVSKNHQGQAFRLKVEADTAQSPMNFDVAYDLSSTISVRSKRNKRRPLKNPPVPITHHIIAGASNPASATSSPSSNPDNEAALASMGAFTTDDRSKQMRLSPTTSSSQKPPSLTNSMESVLGWTGSVVHGLHQLEWQTVGYESKSDGTADPERPIYRCPACWRYKDVMTYETAQHDTKCLIANLLLTYATDTMGHLDFILKSIEQFPAILAAQKSSKLGDGSGSPSLISPQGMEGMSQMSSTQMMASAMMMSGGMGSSSGHYSMSSPMPVSSAPPNLSRGITDMMTGMEAPMLVRANSGGLTELMRTLEDQEGNESTSMFYQGMGGQQSNQVAEAIEMQVFYVLARMITLNTTNAIGFPAFDASMNLLGFYQETRESSSATTEVIFVPVSDIPAITQVEISQTQRLLRTELKDNSSAVHTLARCNNDLVKLKEDVILFHWNAKDRAAPSW